MPADQPSLNATKMWTGYEYLLAYYGLVMSTEWKHRGYVDNLLPYFAQKMVDLTVEGKHFESIPWFIGCEPFHESHRSNLLRKAPEYYSEFFSDTPSDLPYIWTPEEMSVPRVTCVRMLTLAVPLSGLFDRPSNEQF